MKLLPLLLLIILSACHVSRNIQTSQVNTDSLAAHIRDSSDEVRQKIEAYYQQEIKDITNSGVVFQNDPCPDLSAVRASLDSLGKINFDLAIKKDSIIKSLQNKVTIDKNGAITAEGRIKEAFRSETETAKQNQRLIFEKDSLSKLHDSDVVKLSKKVNTRIIVVTKTFIPLWVYLVGIAIAILSGRIGWIAKAKASIQEVKKELTG